jgi:hypothetical protein
VSLPYKLTDLQLVSDAGSGFTYSVSAILVASFLTDDFLKKVDAAPYQNFSAQQGLPVVGVQDSKLFTNLSQRPYTVQSCFP